MFSQNVVDTTDAEVFAKKRKPRLRVLTELDSLVHGSDDVSLRQELVRNELTQSHSDSESGASSGYCGNSDQFPPVVNCPFRWSCVQVIHAVNDFRCLRISINFAVWRHQIRAGRTAPGPGGKGCHHHPYTTSPPLADNGRFSASWLRVQPAGVAFLKGRQHQSTEGCMKLDGQPGARVFQPPPCPELNCTPKDHRRLLVLHHGPGALATPPSCSTWDKFRCCQPAAAVCLGRKREAASRTSFHSIMPTQFFSSTLILARGSVRDPEAHSSWRGPRRRHETQLRAAATLS